MIAPRHQQLTPLVDLPKDAAYEMITPRHQQLTPTLYPGKDPSPWVGDPPSPAAITSAVSHGKAALHNRTVLESLRTPLQVDSPAGRAQRAAATAREVKPMADAAYAVEQATRALANG